MANAERAGKISNHDTSGVAMNTNTLATDEKGRYIGRRRAYEDGTPNPIEDIRHKRKRRNRIIAGVAATGVAIAGIFTAANGILTKRDSVDTASPPSGANAPLIPGDTNVSEENPPEVTSNPPEITQTIRVKPNDSEWQISETVLEEATDEKIRVPAVNATTIINAQINMKNNLAPNPDELNVGQKLVILDAEAVKLINQATNNPSIRPELAAKLRELNSQGTSIEQTAKAKHDVIESIKVDLADQLVGTPIFNAVTHDLGINPSGIISYSEPPEQVQRTTSFIHTKTDMTVEQRKAPPARKERGIPSREISMLRQSEPQIIFSRAQKFSLAA